eukprot:GFUD01054743.1.p1 GENE.GFUD01054743.1~~GFUD01054743.1.p1  ORF type:complete len:398 (+),score=134.47 GFUD01054743.1:72-1265(+)
MVNTSRLYEIVVREREREVREEKRKENAFKRVTKSLSGRWKSCVKLKTKKAKSEKVKQDNNLLSFDFYFSDRDSAYYSPCPSEWNPLEFSNEFCNSEVNYNHSSAPQLTGQSKCAKLPLHKISGLLKDSFKKYKINKGKKQCESVPKLLPDTASELECKFDPLETQSDYPDSGLCHSFDKLLDEAEDSSISSSSFLTTSPPPILIPDISSLPNNQPGKQKPQKTVSLLLPGRRTAEKRFGVHLQLETVWTVSLPDVQQGDIARQQRHIHYQARCQLEDTFPSLSTTISILFTDNPRHLLLSLSSSMIGDLVFQLRTVLFSPLLLMVQSWDVVLCVCIRFLHQVSLILQSVENCQHFHQVWVELQDKCKKCFYQHQVECLTEVRAAYIDMWCKMVEAE